MKKIIYSFLACTLLVMTGCQSAPKEEPILGKWTLDKVKAAEPGKELEDKPKEENASLYGEGEIYYTFEKDGKVVVTEVDGTGAEVETSTTWKKQQDGTYLVSYMDGETFQFEGDELHRIYKAADSSEPFETIDFIYKKVE